MENKLPTLPKRTCQRKPSVTTAAEQADILITGFGAFPETLNRYGYCLGNPIIYIDRTGWVSYIIYDENDDFLSSYDFEVEYNRLEQLYGEFPILCPVASLEEEGQNNFANVWINQIWQENF